MVEGAGESGDVGDGGLVGRAPPEDGGPSDSESHTGIGVTMPGDMATTFSDSEPVFENGYLEYEFAGQPIQDRSPRFGGPTTQERTTDEYLLLGFWAIRLDMFRLLVAVETLVVGLALFTTQLSVVTLQ